ncbi:unnamed protein product [Caenorhabditis brenneri]
MVVTPLSKTTQPSFSYYQQLTILSHEDDEEHKHTVIMENTEFAVIVPLRYPKAIGALLGKNLSVFWLLIIFTLTPVRLPAKVNPPDIPEGNQRPLVNPPLSITLQYALCVVLSLHSSLQTVFLRFFSLLTEIMAPQSTISQCSTIYQFQIPKKCQTPIFKVPRGPAPGTLIRRREEETVRKCTLLLIKGEDLEEAIQQLLMVKSKYSVFMKYETEKHLVESCGKEEELKMMFGMLMGKLERLRKASEEEEKDERGR